MLKYHADFQPRLAQLIAFGVRDIEAIDLNTAAGGGFQPVKQTNQGAFTGAAVADDAVDLPGLHGQVDIINRDNAALRAVKSFANVRKNDHRTANPYQNITAFRPERVTPERGRILGVKGRRNLCFW
ncbi:hypothetical protein D3C79_528780 [compost metagenome]